MTIVDLSDLDTFIRDSLFEVRRGIANSRNATQANPLLGVMVDLPEKIDYEILVTSAYQALSRQSNSIEDRNDFEFTTGIGKNANRSLEGQTSSANEKVYESSSSRVIDNSSAKANAKELDTRTANGVGTESTRGTGGEAESRKGTGSDAESTQGVGSDMENKNGSGSELDARSGAGAELDTKRGSGTEVDTKSGSGTETGTKSGAGTETGTKSGAGTETGTKSESGTEIGVSIGARTLSEKKNSRQTEQHLEANDRGSWTFNEEEGTWGGQGQISTPKYSGTPCDC
jgi:hypothetical protein